MCLGCGGWPFSQVQVAQGPYKDEYVFLDQNHAFYPDHRTGVHPPAPVYQSGQAQQPTMYYYTPNSGTTQPTVYYANGYYYSVPQPPAPAAPSYYCQPVTNPAPPTWTPYSNYSWYNAANAAAAAAAAAATAPSAPTMWVGATKAETDAQNAMIAYNTGSTLPTQLAPYKPSAGQQFWCKELDQSWTLRTYSDIIMGELNPGYWQRSSSGFPFFIRQSPT